jgi:hypothetical protein
MLDGYTSLKATSCPHQSFNELRSARADDFARRSIA